MSSALYSSNDRTLARPAVRSLDGLTTLRFLPAIYVLAFHYATMFFGNIDLPDGLDLGYSGVTFFFMLSGFILAYNYATRDLTDPGNRRRYAIARFARIYPVFILSIVVSIPLFIAVTPPLDGAASWLTFLVRTTLSVLGLHAWVPGAACAINCPSWSISTEIFFYGTFPFLLPLVVRAPKQWLWLTLAVLFSGWSVLGALWHGVGHGLPLTSPETHQTAVTNLVSQFVMYFPLNRLPEFVLGILLYTYWSRQDHRHSAVRLLSAAALAAMALLAARPILPDVALSNGLTAIVWAPVILFGASSTWWPLGAAVPLHLGRISFAIYLFHVPVGQALLLSNTKWLDGWVLANPWPSAIAATGLTFALAMAIYTLVEEPARRVILGSTSERGDHKSADLPNLVKIKNV